MGILKLLIAMILPLFISLSAFAVGNVTVGKVLFEHKCVQCHGVYGDGDTPMSKHTNPAPANFVSKEYKDSNGKNPREYTNNELKDIIMLGKKGTSMVSYAGSIKEDEMNDIVAYIRSLHE